MEDLNKASPSDAPVTKPTSESTANSLEFELISKKPKKFPWLILLLVLIFLGFIAFGVLVYLGNITLPF